MSFTHLHLHSEYSLLDGGNKLERLVNRVKELGMDAVAVTDHGNLHGAMEFYSKAKAVGVKPILGIEAYVAPDRDGKPGDRRDRRPGGLADGGFHLVLLAENDTGWKNLLKLSSDSFLNGFYYRPRMDKSTLAQWADGIIAINGHLGSSIAHHLLEFARSHQQAHWDAAIAEARWHAATFRPGPDGLSRFYVELQRHIEEQERINPLLIRLARELELPLVADNDAHFLREEDWDVHDTLCCISMGKIKQNEDRLHYPRDLYVKSPEQMTALFAECPEAIANSVAIAQRCNVTLGGAANHAPVVRVVGPSEPVRYDGGDLSEWFKEYCARFELLPFDAEKDSELDAAALKSGCDQALRLLCEAGLIWRYGADGVTPAIRERLERELQVLADKLISAYFLIVWDFVNWARQRGIPANARGSGVGTMVGYVLGLSNACPVRYGLLFERFTDPDRSEYPDIDIDICQDGRAAVINYVREKYGYVAQIITFGRLKAKAAVKDVARVFGLTPAEGQRLSNLVPAELGITLEEALQKEPDLRKEYDSNDSIRTVIDQAIALEDHARHAGVHAAGVVIATQPLDTIVPLCKTGGSDDVVTQWDGPTCEKVGLLKMDFLGLRTLSTLELARALIRATLSDEAIWRGAGREPGVGPHPLDLERLEYDDQKVFELFRRADTSGIFQFESGGMRKLLIEMQPDRLEDLIAANALFRPGPMDLIPDYNARKHGRQPVPKVHEIVDRHTCETYGIMVYQEQVMQVLHGLGGIPLRGAYTIIKAISKKKHDVINAARADFVRGAAVHGVAAAKAEELFELILKFAGYGFNKSHSTGYAIIAYQTAYLKTYFPAQYMASVLTFESQARKVEEWSVYLEDCRRTVWPDHLARAERDDHHDHHEQTARARGRQHVGVDVRPPDINLSEAAFAVVFAPGEPRDHCHGHIRFGLGAIKGAGATAVRGIVEERERGGRFTSLFDFCERVDLRAVNKAILESLIKAGAFDTLHGAEARSSMIASIDDAIAAGQTLAADRKAGQMSFFGEFQGAEPASKATVQLRRGEPWDHVRTLAAEKEALGFHVSGHPLDHYRAELAEFCTTDSARVGDLPEDRLVAVGGMLSRVNQIVSRSGKNPGSKMAMITLSDRLGAFDGVLFPDRYAEHGHLLRTDAIVVLTGTVDRSRSRPGLIVDRVIPIETAAQHLGTRLEITFNEAELGNRLRETMSMVKGVLAQAAVSTAGATGRAVEVVIHVESQGRRVTLAASRLRVVPDASLLGQLGAQVGAARVRVRGGFVPERKRQRWQGNGAREKVGAA